MINEENLVKYYTKIAEIINELIPCEWEKVAMYGEQGEGCSEAWFYFFTPDGNYYYSGNIWDEFDVSEAEFDRLMMELWDVDKELWLEFKNAGEKPWRSFTFRLDKDFKFSIKYSYEVNKKLNDMEKEAIWAYDELGIVPEDDYSRGLLKKCLLGQKRELPEELKDV